ncbi:hypothetical protein ACH4ZX_33740 [Streptomyces sp. NPDC020490]|uniref:hypothetical protein n=1 Tax=Streptomyces sp. NPDC020490 TaxID=3365078 RepID=UPI00378ECFA2
MLGLLTLATSAAGCGVSGHTSSATGAERGPQAAPRSDDSEEAFYDYPDQAVVDKAAPGGILKAQKIPALATSLLGSATSRAERIMYRTADADGRPARRGDRVPAAALGRPPNGPPGCTTSGRSPWHPAATRPRGRTS